MNNKTIEAPSSDRGAVLVHVALALIALMSFSTFVIDYGVLWTARRQAQNAADGAALAGAVGLAYDNATDFSNSGPAKTSAYQVLMSHPIWGQQPTVNMTNDITFPTCPDGSGATCIQVDVYRNAAHGNALPMIFGQLVGLSSQGVRAMAMAKVGAANGSDCLKPWGLADKWDERNPTPKAWQYTDTFDGSLPGGAFGPDLYTPQNGTTSAGTGFTLANDFGTMVQLKVGQPGDAVNPGWFQPLDLGGGNGAAGYKANIMGCVGTVWKIGDDLPKENGNMIGPTGSGVNELIGLDPGAYWDATMNGGKGGVAGSCVTTNTCRDSNNNPVQYSTSPRIIAVPVFDLALYLSTGGTGNGTVRMVNILGFFVNSMAGNDVTGYLAAKPALLVTGGGSVAPGASFVKVVHLIR